MSSVLQGRGAGGGQLVGREAAACLPESSGLPGVEVVVRETQPDLERASQHLSVALQVEVERRLAELPGAIAGSRGTAGDARQASASPSASSSVG